MLQPIPSVDCKIWFLLQELRRGTEPAHIYSIAMSPNCDWLAVSSDKGTVHVFSLANNVQTMASDKVEAATNSANPMLNGGPASPTALPGGSDGASTSGPRHNPTSVFSMVKVSRVAPHTNTTMAAELAWSQRVLCGLPYYSELWWQLLMHKQCAMSSSVHEEVVMCLLLRKCIL